MYPFEFDIEKAVEAILYIVEKGAKPTFHHISKIFYFADKKHLEDYGRLICGDNYVAMKHGPVPSSIYDILKFARENFDSDYYQDETIQKLKEAISVTGRYIVQNERKPNLDYFSESDLECLDYAIENYGQMEFNDLTKISHDSSWKKANENDIIELEDIISTFENSEELLEYLNDPHPGVA